MTYTIKNNCRNIMSEKRKQKKNNKITIKKKIRNNFENTNKKKRDYGDITTYSNKLLNLMNIELIDDNSKTNINEIIDYEHLCLMNQKEQLKIQKISICNKIQDNENRCNMVSNITNALTNCKHTNNRQLLNKYNNELNDIKKSIRDYDKINKNIHKLIEDYKKREHQFGELAKHGLYEINYNKLFES